MAKCKFTNFSNRVIFSRRIPIVRFVFAILLYSCASANYNNDAKKSSIVLDSPQNITERELIVASDIKKEIGNCDLTGTLLLPAESPPRALAFFIHGSGPNNRNESSPQGHKIFSDIALKLGQQGIASFRFDKRVAIRECVQAVVNNSMTYTPSDTIQDVINVVENVANRKEFSALPLIIIGHSEGVNFATELLSNTSKFNSKAKNTILDRTKALIALAGLGKYPIDKTIIRQFTAQLSLPLIPQQARDQINELIRQGNLFFARVRAHQAAPSESYMNVHSLYWQEWIQITDRASESAKGVLVPTLLLQGTRDTQITKEDFEALGAAFSGNQLSESVMIPELDHMFSTQNSISLDPRVTNALLEFLKKL